MFSRIPNLASPTFGLSDSGFGSLDSLSSVGCSVASSPISTAGTVELKFVLLYPGGAPPLLRSNISFLPSLILCLRFANPATEICFRPESLDLDSPWTSSDAMEPASMDAADTDVAQEVFAESEMPQT